MPQPDRRPRLDSYGKPLPELTEARQAITQQEPGNQAKLALLHALVEETCRAVMRRGWYGTVNIRFAVQNGRLEQDFYTSLERQWRQEGEP